VIAGIASGTEAQRVRALFTLLATTAALSLAGTASAASAAATKAEFIQRGDALCARTARELAPLRRRAEAAMNLSQHEQLAAVAAIWADQVRIQVRFNKNVRAIGAPPNDSVARALLARLDRGVILARRIRDAFASARIATLASALPAYIDFTVKLNRQIRAYGFRVCGRS
jgi:hypothetical protein